MSHRCGSGVHNVEVTASGAAALFRVTRFPALPLPDPGVRRSGPPQLLAHRAPGRQPRAVTATMGHRCCSAGPGNRIDGPWMSLPQQRWPIDAVARPRRTASLGHRCGDLSGNVRFAGAAGQFAAARSGSRAWRRVSAGELPVLRVAGAAAATRIGARHPVAGPDLQAPANLPVPSSLPSRNMSQNHRCGNRRHRRLAADPTSPEINISHFRLRGPRPSLRDDGGGPGTGGGARRGGPGTGAAEAGGARRGGPGGRRRQAARGGPGGAAEAGGVRRATEAGRRRQAALGGAGGGGGATEGGAGVRRRLGPRGLGPTTSRPRVPWRRLVVVR